MSTTTTSTSSSSSSSTRDKYSVILPTYNERRNLPIVIWLLVRTFNQQSVQVASSGVEGKEQESEERGARSEERRTAARNRATACHTT